MLCTHKQSKENLKNPKPKNSTNKNKCVTTNHSLETKRHTTLQAMRNVYKKKKATERENTANVFRNWKSDRMNEESMITTHHYIMQRSQMWPPVDPGPAPDLANSYITRRAPHLLTPSPPLHSDISRHAPVMVWRRTWMQDMTVYRAAACSVRCLCLSGGMICRTLCSLYVLNIKASDNCCDLISLSALFSSLSLGEKCLTNVCVCVCAGSRTRVWTVTWPGKGKFVMRRCFRPHRPRFIKIIPSDCMQLKPNPSVTKIIRRVLFSWHYSMISCLHKQTHNKQLG